MIKKMMTSFTIRNSLQSKLVLLILVVATIPLLTLGYVLYNKSSETINKQFGKYGDVSVSQLQFQIDASLGQMKYTLSEVLSYVINPEFIELHQEVPSSYKEFLEEQKLEQFLKSHKTMDMKGIFIINQSGYYYGDKTINVNRLRNEPWFIDTNAKEDEYNFNIYEPIHYSGLTRIPNEKVIGLLFKIRNQTGMFANSRILIEIRAEKLLNLFQDFERNTGSVLKITDAGQTIIYQTAGSVNQKSNDVVWQKHSAETNWNIEIRTPYNHFYKPSLIIRTFTFTVVGFSLLLALLLAFIISFRFIKRIKRMKESIYLVSIGNLSTRIPVDSEDEIGRVSQHFNSMVVQLQALFNEVMIVEQKKKEAELRALHHQINPHLLINTLASIQWMARLQGALDVTQMIHHLTKVLEGNLKLTKELVTLEQELSVIDHYLKVQEFRYGKVFTYRILNQGVRLNEVEIPRMTLQPLIENIFFHGFEDGEGDIDLRVDRDEQDIVISVIDNGKGMAEDIRAAMLKSHSKAESKTNIGMYNVHQRIKLHFGEPYGLTVVSKRGEGTKIEIRLPERRNEA